MKRSVIMVMIILYTLTSCGKKKTEDRYSMPNIISASWRIIKDKGFGALSSEEINREIDRQYLSPEDELGKKSTLRQRQADGSNNYKIIFEDMIEKDKQEKERKYRDPLK